MTLSNYITKVAVVGASGNVGSHITSALLSTGKHTITAITRADSKGTFPSGVIAKTVDYSQPETIVEALEGQEALVITLTPRAGDAEVKLVNAAGEAGVKYILTNEWCPDSENEGLVKDVSIFAHRGQIRKTIADLGKSSYISVGTGFWYEWSLAIPDAYGIDIQNRRATFFDEGETKISTSTWPQVGRAVAKLLSLPITSSDTASPSLEKYANKVVHISSFTLSQKEMLASVLRVTNTTELDWAITKEDAVERYAEAAEEVAKGSYPAFARLMYTRVFYKDGTGDLSGRVIDGELGLPQDDMDEATRVAVQRSKTNPMGY